MKKTYIVPEAKVVMINTCEAFLTASYSNEQSSTDAPVFSREGRGFGDDE